LLPQILGIPRMPHHSLFSQQRHARIVHLAYLLGILLNARKGAPLRHLKHLFN